MPKHLSPQQLTRFRDEGYAFPFRAVSESEADDYRRRIVKMGFTPVGGTPEQFRNLISSSIDKWAVVVHDAKIKAE